MDLYSYFLAGRIGLDGRGRAVFAVDFLGPKDVKACTKTKKKNRGKRKRTKERRRGTRGAAAGRRQVSLGEREGKRGRGGEG